MPINRKNIRESAYICNVSNMRSEHEFLRRWVKPDGRVAGKITYVVEPADPKKGYSVTSIGLTYQAVLDRAADPEKPHQFIDRETDAVVEAESIVTKCKQVIGSGAGAYPGVGRIEGPEPTEAELDSLRAQHEAWCRFLIRHADELYADPQRRGHITEMHQKAGEYMDLENSPEHPWLRQLRSGTHKRCIACGGLMLADRTVCPSCRTELVDYCVKMEYEPAFIKERDPFIAPLVTKARQKASLAETQAAKKEKAAAAA